MDWQGVIGTTLLYGSLLIHPCLGVWSLYARRYVGWRAPEIVQLVLGLSIPALLANHVAVTRGQNCSSTPTRPIRPSCT